MPLPKPVDAHEAVDAAWPQWDEEAYSKAGLTELRNAIVAGNNADISKFLNNLTVASFEGTTGDELMQLFSQYHVNLAQMDFNHKSRAGTMLEHAQTLLETKINLTQLDANHKAKYMEILREASTGELNQSQFQSKVDELNNATTKSAGDIKGQFDEKHTGVTSNLTNPTGNSPNMSQLQGLMGQLGQLGQMGSQGGQQLSQLASKTPGMDMIKSIGDLAKNGAGGSGSGGGTPITKEAIKSLLASQKTGKDDKQDSLLSKAHKADKSLLDKAHSSSSTRGSHGLKNSEQGVKEHKSSGTTLGSPDEEESTENDSDEEPKEGVEHNAPTDEKSSPNPVTSAPSTEAPGASSPHTQLSSDENSRDTDDILTTHTSSDTSGDTSEGTLSASSPTMSSPVNGMPMGGMPMGGMPPMGQMGNGNSSSAVSVDKKNPTTPIKQVNYKLFGKDDVTFLSNMNDENATVPLTREKTDEEKSASVLLSVLSQFSKEGISTPIAVGHIKIGSEVLPVILPSHGVGFIPPNIKLPSGLITVKSPQLPLTPDIINSYAGSKDPAWVLNQLSERGIIPPVRGLVTSGISRENSATFIDSISDVIPAPLNFSLSYMSTDTSKIAKHGYLLRSFAQALNIPILPLIDAEINATLFQWEGNSPDPKYIPAFASYVIASALHALQEPYSDLGYSTYALSHLKLIKENLTEQRGIKSGT